MTIQWLLSWWNLIFVVPFALAVLYLGIYTLSGWTFGDADADADMDADADVDAHIDADVDAHIDADVDSHLDADVDAHLDADTDVDADADTDADTDAETDVDHDSDHDTEAQGAGGGSQPSLALQALSWVGIGKVPASIVLTVLALSWGFIGFVTNQAAREPFARAIHRDNPAFLALVSLPIAAIGSLLISSGLSRLAAKILPKNETYAQRRHALLGSVGEALYDIDRRFGMANVRDDQGNLFQIGCRSERTDNAIPKGSHVKLIGYNAKEQLFYVVRM